MMKRTQHGVRGANKIGLMMKVDITKARNLRASAKNAEFVASANIY